MGYVNTLPYQYLELGLELQPGGAGITSVAADLGPFAETLPSFIGEVQLAFLDFVPSLIRNTRAGANYLNGAQYIQWKKNGGVYVSALKLSDQCFYMNASGNYTQNRIYGNTNIANEIVSGDPILWKWDDARAAFDSIYLDGCFQIVLRLYIQ